jgi:hypothetical protein
MARVARSMVRHTGSEDLLRALDVEIVDDLDDELAAAARQWLADVRRANGTLSPWLRITTSAVRDALRSYDKRKDRDDRIR